MKPNPLTGLTLWLSASLVAPFALAANPPATVDPAHTAGQQSGADMTELAKKLNNPAASLISVPLQSNFDFGAGPDGDGFQYKLNIQPVIPIPLNEDWKILSRTILPFVYQEKIIGKSSQTGLGDMNMTLWLSPAKEKEGAPIWGLGPVLQFPTATDDLLGTEKWGIGPSAILVHQANGWTSGALVNHIWSVAGDSDRQDISVTSIQPFLNYTTKKRTTFGVNSEANYDWENEQWTVPLNVFVTQLVKIGGRPVSFQLGGRYYAEAPDQGPEWGLRFSVTFVFPE